MRETRIIDANLNRAREAARVLEDFARLGLSDPGLAGRLRRLRHAITEAARASGLDLATLAAARDAGKDPGRAASGTDARADIAAVVEANAARLCEALRCCEEYARTFAPSLAADAERIRFEAYDLAAHLALRARPARRMGTPLLCVIASGRASRLPLTLAVDAALAGGADMIQVREKAMDDKAFMELARTLVAPVRRAGAMFVVNDRVDCAMALGADGVHLGQGDLPVAEARRLMGPGPVIGASAHSLAQATLAEAAGADYVAIGPAWPTATKPDEPAVGLAVVREVAACLRVPVVAIGGIAPENAGQVAAAGVRRVAVCAAVMSADDPEAAARMLKAAL